MSNRIEPLTQNPQKGYYNLALRSNSNTTHGKNLLSCRGLLIGDAINYGNKDIMEEGQNMEIEAESQSQSQSQKDGIISEINPIPDGVKKEVKELVPEK